MLTSRPHRRPFLSLTLPLALCSALAFAPASAQSAGALRGTVADSSGHPLAGASVHIGGTTLGTIADSSGRYHVTRIPAGSHIVRVQLMGFAAESAAVQIVDGGSVEHDFRLHPSVAILGSLVVNAQRMGESQAAAVAQRQQAPNVVAVLAGDVIRALPNANAAEAAGHMPGVTTERDEGEGKSIEVRGTEPRLSNVTIDGAHVPGTLKGSRVPKLDDIPSDILGAIEVSKTLTADMDADAIGGSVNLVTKTPEGDPQGYISGQYGAVTLLSRSQYQGGFAYGGRFGKDGKLGMLIGGSVDRNGRVINDMEPGWATDDAGNAIPIEWNQRDYVYRRTRYGLGGDVDYRFSNGSNIAIKGLFSRLENFGTTYYSDIVTGATPSTFNGNGDSASAGGRGYATGVEVSQIAGNHTPLDQLYGGTMSGRTQLGPFAAKLIVNAARTTENIHDHRFSPFVYDGPGGQGLTVAYNASDTKTPTYSWANSAMQSGVDSPGNYSLTDYHTDDLITTGLDFGTGVDLSAPWRTSENSSWTNEVRFGGKFRLENKDYTRMSAQWHSDNPIGLMSALGSFSDPHYYSHISPGFAIGPMPNEPLTRSLEAADGFTNVTDTLANILGSLSGREDVYAAYVSNTATLGRFELYLGLRMEHTVATYIGHSVSQDTTGAVTAINTVPGSQKYTDLFPSAQLKFTTSPETDIRFAFTRGLARPDYSQLAPSLQGTQGGNITNPENLTTGNPALKAQHAWNYDLLAEHFFPSVGVLSGGVFYKSLSDFIFNKTFVYNGPITEFDGQHGTRPENGGSGHLFGIEAEWNQRFVFLPGWWAGFGIDANYTYTQSRVLVDPTTNRFNKLQRQAPNLANVALTYNNGRVSSRLGWSYQGANIFDYGDGTPTPNGDVYMYAHSQFDGSIMFNLTQRLQLQLQALNINNAVFGFFAGTPQHDYSLQREYYGQTIYFGTKYDF